VQRWAAWARASASFAAVEKRLSVALGAATLAIGAGGLGCSMLGAIGLVGLMVGLALAGGPASVLARRAPAK
jgi:hypothetical protein